MGGGGFSMEDDRLLDDYILALTGRDRPRVGFVGTASGDHPSYIEKFHAALSDRAETSDLRLFSEPSHDPAVWFAAQDVIYVGGGSTANLLAVWRVHGLDRLARAAYEAGTILCGVSAGAICWFQGGTTDSFGPLRALHDGVGILEGSFTPHYDGEADRRPALRRAIEEGLPAGLAADDYAAAHFVDGQLHAAVASREGARVYRVALGADGFTEEALATRFLA
ncbi:MAG: peptidase E [Chloroflexi bacterium]|nr:peptidase E [Chloroflexota bacterium]